MKEIKAYIRVEKAEEVVHALEEAGVPGLTAVEVNCIGAGIEKEKAKYSINLAEKVCPKTKLEIVCTDRDAERLVEIIKEKAWTSRKGDGIIFMTEISDAIKIGTGVRGEDALLAVNEKEKT